MSYLDDLERKLSRLKNQKKNLESQIKTYEKRKGQVEDLNSKLGAVGDDNYSSVNKFADKIVDSMMQALIGVASAGAITGDVSGQREQSSGSDSNISSALDDFRQEIRDINNKLNDLNSSLRSVKYSIERTKDDIDEEERRIREERLRKLKEVIMGN